ncbi:hypothetical protein [Pelomonas cellulosilytica]|uniref:Uncharacterized protein n=1 Tax=Pelomonas cellulosilytica TaxID=2906762 RepID=A0ABS8XQB1_9BURK|nr:hypothetical protein [Pelomonas sp. P8]MCE4553092.1 hypothetical protein [Pelomonas sp. P8]
MDTHFIRMGPREPRLALELLVLGALLGLAWRACRGTHRHRHSARCARTPAAVHTWEGEGGRPTTPEQVAGGNEMTR